MWMAPEIIMGKKYTESQSFFSSAVKRSFLLLCFCLLIVLLCFFFFFSLSLSLLSEADVYAFGIILWEILTRLEPYEEKEPMQIVVEVVNDGLRPTLPAECADSPMVPLMKDWSVGFWQQRRRERTTAAIKEAMRVYLLTRISSFCLLHPLSLSLSFLLPPNFSWHTDPIQRPPFEKIVDRLRSIQAAIPTGDNSPHGLPNTSISKAGQTAAHGANIAGDAASPTR